MQDNAVLHEGLYEVGQIIPSFIGNEECTLSVVNRLAKALNYVPGVLPQDMKAVKEYIEELDINK